MSAKNPPSKNAIKQKRYRERRQAEGKKEVRGYLSTEALSCYEEIVEKTGWSDSELLTHAIRLTYAAYKLGQVPIMHNWLEKNSR